jgi:hypothetical protein
VGAGQGEEAVGLVPFTQAHLVQSVGVGLGATLGAGAGAQLFLVALGRFPARVVRPKRAT